MSSFKIIVILLFGLLELNSARNYYPRSKGDRASRQHNEQCVPYDSSASCNNTQGLMCIDTGLKGYRCLCPSNTLHAQVYDAKRETCVGKVLNTCVRSGSYRDLNDSLCVENAECDTAMYGMAICMCKPGFTEDDEGGCVPSLGYLEVCGNGHESTSTSATATTETKNVQENTSTSKPKSIEADDADEADEADRNRRKRKVDESQRKCDEKRGLSCINSKCQCKFGSEQFYNETEKKCVSYGGGRCADGSNVYSCVSNAKCPVTSTMSRPSRLPIPPPFLTEIDNKEDKQDEEGNESVLVIPFPFKPPRFPFPPSLHHRLPPPFHFNHASASASGGHASASTHNQPQFNPLEDIGSMKFEVDFGRSGRSIFFKKNKTDYYPRCECLPGFSLSDGFCMKSYGSRCDPNDDKCNPDQYLECMESQDPTGGFTCQCRNPLNERFDLEKNTCVAIMGKRCKVGATYPNCEKGECLNERCTCKNGTSLTPMGKCAKNHAEPCEPGECNLFHGLICHGKSEKKCQCLDSYMIPSKNGRCLASGGDDCGSLNIGVRPEIYVECEDGYKCTSTNQANKGQQSAVSRCVKI